MRSEDPGVQAPMPLNELAALMKADHDKLTPVVKASGITPQYEH